MALTNYLEKAAVRINGSLPKDGSEGITGNLDIAGDLSVGGDSVLVGAVTTSSLTATGLVQGADLTATDDLSVGDDATITGTLEVNGQAILAGTATNDDAVAGDIGQIISANVASGSAVALTTGVAANVTSISLTAGDWDVSAGIGYFPAATTSITALISSISSTSATLDQTPGNVFVHRTAAIVPGNLANAFVHPAGPVRKSLSGTTTIYLVAFANFTVSTMGAYGFIRARRVR